MSYRITFSCDHDRCDRREYIRRPEPSSFFSDHVPEGWGMAKPDAGNPASFYYVYCPDHFGEH